MYQHYFKVRDFFFLIAVRTNYESLCEVLFWNGNKVNLIKHLIINKTVHWTITSKALSTLTSDLNFTFTLFCYGMSFMVAELLPAQL